MKNAIPKQRKRTETQEAPLARMEESLRQKASLTIISRHGPIQQAVLRTCLREHFARALAIPPIPIPGAYPLYTMPSHVPTAASGSTTTGFCRAMTWARSASASRPRPWADAGINTRHVCGGKPSGGTNGSDNQHDLFLRVNHSKNKIRGNNQENKSARGYGIRFLPWKVKGFSGSTTITTGK